MTNKKIAIIGSGPSGLTAGIYTARANLSTNIYSGSQPGGQLTTTSEVENFPGFPEGIDGPKLMNNMQKQAERFGAKMIFSEVSNLEIDKKDDKPSFKVITPSSEDAYNAIIIASGASAKYLGIKDEEKWIGKGYHSCATCDGFFYRNKVIAVVGGGDSAMEEANFLTKFASKVYLIHRRDVFQASKIMLERARKNPNIEFLINQKVVDFVSGENGKLAGVKIENTQNGQQSQLDLQGLFVAIGHIPNTSFVKGKLNMDQIGYLLPKHRTMSEVEGIFIAGDVEDKVYRQAITAAGGGCRAAMDCEGWLGSQS
jgi:thioredoxin reductase (NADPH)